MFLKNVCIYTFLFIYLCFKLNDLKVLQKNMVINLQLA